MLVYHPKRPALASNPLFETLVLGILIGATLQPKDPVQLQVLSIRQMDRYGQACKQERLQEAKGDGWTGRHTESRDRRHIYMCIYICTE